MPQLLSTLRLFGRYDLMKSAPSIGRGLRRRGFQLIVIVSFSVIVGGQLDVPGGCHHRHHGQGWEELVDRSTSRVESAHALETKREQDETRF